MSYDLRVFSCLDPAAALKRLAARRTIERDGDVFVLGGDGWQIVLNAPDEVEAGDLPPAVSAALPGIRFSVEINVEGDYKKAHLAKARMLAKDVAKSSRGVVLDEQTETIETPRGIKRIDLSGGKGDVEVLEMAWWFEDHGRLIKGLGAIISAMETHAPEALPNRYGLWEPPQFRYEDKGRAHFLSFLRKNLGDPIVWYPSKPFTHAWIDAIKKPGGSEQGYRCNRLSLEIDARALDVPGWPVAIRRLFVAIAEVLQPFYGEICRGESPIRAWFFNGIPKQLGLAAIIGPPYDKLWPEFGAQADAVGKLRMMETLETKKPLKISPPRSIAQPEPYRSPDWTIVPAPGTHEKQIAYPKTWPFASPFGGDA